MATWILKRLMAIGVLRRWFRRRYCVEAKELQQELFEHRFENPVGLAPGYDKNAEIFVEMTALGFGFIEIGTVTAKAQPGNPKPRLFRLVKDRALVNRMGFNNDGAEAVRERLQRRAPVGPLGVNIGRSKVVPNEEAIKDYCESLEQLWEFASYITVNVSSPNTPELRALQTKERLTPLLRTIKTRAAGLAEEAKRTPPPVLVKIAPDLDDDEIDDLCEVVTEIGLDGIICTNTTISREGLTTEDAEVEKLGAGGLSGRPLRKRALEVLRRVRANLSDEIPIIASGGISNAEHAWESIRAGANLIQIYTALIYEGPSLMRRINRGLVKHLREGGFSSLSEAVGGGRREM